MTLPGPQLPWPAQRRPLSVVAFGNSVASMQLPLRSDRAEGTYAEVLADLLAAEGVPAVVHLESRWFDFLHRAMRHYESRVRVHAPDVLLVQFGLNEYQPWLLPIPVVRHLMVQNQATTRTASVLMASRRLPNTDLATPLMSSAIRIAGKVSCTSAMRMISPSTAPPNCCPRTTYQNPPHVSGWP